MLAARALRPGPPGAALSADRLDSGVHGLLLSPERLLGARPVQDDAARASRVDATLATVISGTIAAVDGVDVPSSERVRLLAEIARWRTVADHPGGASAATRAWQLACDSGASDAMVVAAGALCAAGVGALAIPAPGVGEAIAALRERVARDEVPEPPSLPHVRLALALIDFADGDRAALESAFAELRPSLTVGERVGMAVRMYLAEHGLALAEGDLGQVDDTRRAALTVVPGDDPDLGRATALLLDLATASQGEVPPTLAEDLAAWESLPGTWFLDACRALSALDRGVVAPATGLLDDRLVARADPSRRVGCDRARWRH